MFFFAWTFFTVGGKLLATAVAFIPAVSVDGFFAVSGNRDGTENGFIIKLLNGL